MANIDTGKFYHDIYHTNHIEDLTDLTLRIPQVELANYADDLILFTAYPRTVKNHHPTGVEYLKFVQKSYVSYYHTTPQPH